MENFIAYNPTKVHFGKNVVNQLGESVEKYGRNVLLMYGKGSVLRNGSYDDTIRQLQDIGAVVHEFSGIKPNPVVQDVDSAARLGIEKEVELIVAVGGGSVIDSAKITAVCIAEKCSGWEVMKDRVTIRSSIPLIGVLTLAATGTEMNNVAVLQNPETREKIGYGHDTMYPAHSFLDPGYTASVPENYTAYGIVDLIAHAMENFFGKGDARLSDRFVEGIIKEAFDFSPDLMGDLQNYELRARMMWAATNALNGLTGFGRSTGDWGVHALGHVLSFLYDTPHGATLSIVYPAWLKVLKPRIGDRIKQLGYHLYGTGSIDHTISNIEAFFQSVGSPVRLNEIGLGENDCKDILGLMNEGKASGWHYILSDKDREEMVGLML